MKQIAQAYYTHIKYKTFGGLQKRNSTCESQIL